MQDPKEKDETMIDAETDEQNSSGEKELTAEEKHAVYMKQVQNVPLALPTGWVVRYSRSQPDYQYFFHQDTGECQWEMPVQIQRNAGISNLKKKTAMIDTDSLLSAVIQQASNQEHGSRPIDPKNTNLYRVDNKDTTNENDKIAANTSNPISSTAPTHAAPSGIMKRKSKYTSNANAEALSANVTPSNSALRPSKRARKDHPKEVRVLHILKKHAKSRRPSSWKTKHITISKDEAIAELQELISMLKEVEEMNDPKELRATFEELAKTESDCSSSKRGGDLGFFGRKKMQPAFEKASFALKIGQLSEIVETSSGVHVILRLG